jgi:23S rRNA pseudouridine2605 synthase
MAKQNNAGKRNSGNNKESSYGRKNDNGKSRTRNSNSSPSRHSAKTAKSDYNKSSSETGERSDATRKPVRRPTKHKEDQAFGNKSDSRTTENTKKSYPSKEYTRRERTNKSQSDGTQPSTYSRFKKDFSKDQSGNKDGSTARNTSNRFEKNNDRNSNSSKDYEKKRFSKTTSTDRNDRNDNKEYKGRRNESSSYKKDSYRDSNDKNYSNRYGSDSRAEDGRKPQRNTKNFGKRSSETWKPVTPGEEVRLNKFIANSGRCSRREADELIISGAVTVNDKIVTELGTKVKPTDIIKLGGEKLSGEKPVYVLLNKPKDYVANDEPGNKKSVMMLIAKACKERVYQVGRLDRTTTGLLLFTNDIEVANKLTNPKNRIPKLFQAELDKNIRPADLETLRSGVQLEYGIVRAEEVSLVGESKNIIGIQIMSGRNRAVRNLLEALGYKVIKLDRVMYAGLTKKDLPRGRYRLLTRKEIAYLKMM